VQDPTPSPSVQKAPLKQAYIFLIVILIDTVQALAESVAIG